MGSSPAARDSVTSAPSAANSTSTTLIHEMMRRSRALALGLAMLPGCGDPYTQVAVTIDGDRSVMQQLRRIEVKVYATDAAEQESPSSHSFSLPAGSTGEPAARQPLTFGIQRGKSDHFELVVEGYASLDASAAFVIERKVFGRFESRQTRALPIYLSAECLNLSSPCRALQKTCRPSARACAAVEEQATTEGVVAEAADPTPDASITPGPCAAAQDCKMPDYLCTSTVGTGYTCLGQFADWTMPDRSAVAKAAPRYDDKTTPGLVHDTVTGLSWQRDLPATYPGCTGSQPVVPERGSTCTWDEAKIYCSELSIDGRRFRVPSKIELESIIDLGAPLPPFDTKIFPGPDSMTEWTSSPVADSLGKDAVFSWAVGWPGAALPQATSMTAAVRCVSGTPQNASTPAQRYVVDGDDVIRDVHTGLAWRRSVSRSLPSDTEAARYCEELGGGFRIPTYKELLTLVDPTRFGPAIDPVFTDTPNVAFWSEPRAAPAPLKHGALLVDFHQGAAYPAGSTRLPNPGGDRGSPRVRCVR